MTDEPIKEDPVEKFRKLIASFIPLSAASPTAAQAPELELKSAISKDPAAEELPEGPARPESCRIENSIQQARTPTSSRIAKKAGFFKCIPMRLPASIKAVLGTRRQGERP